jgi:phage pi2 protein 07
MHYLTYGILNMTIKPIELIENYFILVDDVEQTEYQDSKGDNFMFTSRKEAEQFINNHFQFIHVGG